MGAACPPQHLLSGLLMRPERGEWPRAEHWGEQDLQVVSRRFCSTCCDFSFSKVPVPPGLPEASWAGSEPHCSVGGAISNGSQVTFPSGLGLLHPPRFCVRLCHPSLREALSSPPASVPPCSSAGFASRAWGRCRPVRAQFGPVPSPCVACFTVTKWPSLSTAPVLVLRPALSDLGVTSRPSSFLTGHSF